MKLHLAHFGQQNIFSGYGDGYVMINQIRHEKNMIVFPDQLIEHWPVASVAALSHEHFDEILARKPEIILLGTGAQLRFPDYTLMARILQTRTGFEVMDTQAACRTYNILVEEGRQVAAAIIL
ncbi:MAG: Mth938-like domain-containing protein [Nitrosomonas sp.]|nr:Mth938-like domain-containing protein [Burkholderiales bacterium]MCP5291753.1 Mth938-like domain-containing protein [Burkholderiales bacterium]MDR4520337.1 Mth938-like domain-containing protein [Nitrosomonas sp.]MDR4651278.1 Mth938-like domain-containing protein [Nitrosomonas sp.]